MLDTARVRGDAHTFPAIVVNGFLYIFHYSEVGRIRELVSKDILSPGYFNWWIV